MTATTPTIWRRRVTMRRRATRCRSSPARSRSCSCFRRATAAVEPGQRPAAATTTAAAAIPTRFFAGHGQERHHRRRAGAVAEHHQRRDQRRRHVNAGLAARVRFQHAGGGVFGPRQRGHRDLEGALWPLQAGRGRAGDLCRFDALGAMGTERLLQPDQRQRHHAVRHCCCRTPGPIRRCNSTCSTIPSA